MVRFIRLKPADPENRAVIHVNVQHIVSITPQPEAGSILDLIHGVTLRVLDKPGDILKEIHSQPA